MALSQQYLATLGSGHLLHPHGHPAGPSRQNSGTYPRSGTQTPLLTATSTPRAERDGLGARLRGMLERPKYALFDVKVEILELGNVPQSEGVFEARWKFNGHKPQGKEAARLRPKASMPDLRGSQTPHYQSAAQSTISLRSSDTSFSSVSSPAASLHSGASGATTSRRQTGRSATMPPAAVMGMTPANPRNSPPRVGKKASDPTPLRQSMGPDGKVTESPESTMNEIHTPPKTSRESSIAQSIRTQGSPRSSTDLQRPGGLHINTGVRQDSSRGTSAASNWTSASYASTSSRNGMVPAPLRSGTGPSPAVLLGPPGMSQPDRPPIVVRSPTDVSRHSVSASAPDLVRDPEEEGRNELHSVKSKDEHHDQPRHTDKEKKKDSDKHGKQSNESHHRKGVTPARRLKQHTCTWEYSITHTIRVPTGKIVSATPAASGAATPSSNRREMAPILGGGPTSDSGFRLIIQEIRTQHSMTTDHSHVADAAKKVAPPKEERTVFGIVEIDLAPFAGKGRMMRRFLLKGSRTNATVKVAVDMKQVGGEANWAAPPLREGHHVTGMRDLVGDESQSLRADLALHRNSSNSDTESCVSDSQPSGTSSLNLQKLRTRSRSDASLSKPPPKVGYKGYEHHLKPADALNRQARPRVSVSPNPKTPPDSPNGLSPTVVDPGSPPDLSSLSPLSPGSGSSGHFRRDSVLPFHHRRRNMHNHHSLHMRHSPFSLISADHGSHRHSHSHQHGHGHGHGHKGIYELQPEVIIEAVFNPKPANEEGPMTYIPSDGGLGLELRSEEAVVTDHVTAALEDDMDEAYGDGGSAGTTTPPVSVKKARGWGIRRAKLAREKKERDEREVQKIKEKEKDGERLRNDTAAMASASASHGSLGMGLRRGGVGPDGKGQLPPAAHTPAPTMA